MWRLFVRMRLVRQEQFLNNSCCCCWTCPPAALWMWSSYLLPNLSWRYSTPPPTHHIWHREPFYLFPKMKRPLIGEGFSDISDTQNCVTELRKGFHCRTCRALSRTSINDLHVACSWKANMLKSVIETPCVYIPRRFRTFAKRAYPLQHVRLCVRTNVP